MTQKLPQILTDIPITQLKNWAGFSAKKEKTMLPSNFLVEPSKNCFIPDTDKIVPREGTQIVFQGSTPILNVPTIGGYPKFKNFAGIEMDVKAYRDATEGEQVYVLFNNVYVPITLNPNTNFNGTGRIYFSTYTDSNLDLSQDKRIPRLGWVNGYKHTDGTGRVFTWTGGISPIDNIVGAVISLPVGQTWGELGFTEYFFNGAFTGEIHVTINGVDYFSTILAELDTNSLTLNVVPTAVIGDIVTSTVEIDSLVAPMDILKQNKNYMYYGNFMFRQWWMSNQFGRPESVIQTESNAELDDMNVVSLPSSYTGTSKNIYRVQIVAIDPPVDIENQFFYGGGLNDGTWDTSAYSAGAGENVYKIIIVADFMFTFAGAPVPSPTPGETLTGNISGAQGIVVAVDPILGQDPTLQMLPGSPAFQIGETVTGTISGLIPQVIFSGGYQDVFRVYKNGAPILAGAPYAPVPGYYYFSILNPAQTFIVADGITFIFETYIGHTLGSYWELTIDQNVGSPDDFGVSKNGGTIVGSVAITGASQTTAQLDGISIQFADTTGHKVGDYWIIEANRGVVRPWADFYYTLDFATKESVRRPGEGYVYSLPSNFWTMDTFEEAMYVNTSNGEWGYSNPQLSADLKSEDISFVPLKQNTASKVLYPYLTGHNRNDLLFIDENKNLTSIGRLQLIERVQMEDMSDFVRNAFNNLSWVDGSIIFQDDKTWLTSPEDGTMLCFDERTKYWQPPQVIPNLGLLTIVGTQLYTHSTLNTATRSLNDSSASGDDGVEYEVIARNSTYDHGNRWIQKKANMAFWEGYVDESPPMKMKVYFDVDGCAGIKQTNITPIYCTDVVNHGNFGGAEHGEHEHGGDETNATNYARFQYKDLGVHSFYFSSLEFLCRAKKHPYQILSMGINLAESQSNNKGYRSPESSIDTLLPLE